jgi:hypothetical protein
MKNLNNNEDLQMVEFLRKLDDLIMEQQDNFSAHEISGMLLSRLTLLMSNDLPVGKELLKFVWDKLDELEQSNPGQFL